VEALRDGEVGGVGRDLAGFRRDAEGKRTVEGGDGHQVIVVVNGAGGDGDAGRLELANRGGIVALLLPARDDPFTFLPNLDPLLLLNHDVRTDFVSDVAELERAAAREREGLVAQQA